MLKSLIIYLRNILSWFFVSFIKFNIFVFLIWFPLVFLYRWFMFGEYQILLIFIWFLKWQFADLLVDSLILKKEFWRTLYCGFTWNEIKAFFVERLSLRWSAYMLFISMLVYYTVVSIFEILVATNYIDPSVIQMKLQLFVSLYEIFINYWDILSFGTYKIYLSLLINLIFNKRYNNLELLRRLIVNIRHNLTILKILRGLGLKL